MNLSRFSVKRPVFTSMVMLILILLGFISLRRLPIDLMPDITFPTLNIYTYYENASPEEVEELITRPIEEAMSAVPGVEEVTAFSIEGRSTVRVSFSWGRDLDEAANDIRDRLDRVMSRLPEGVDRPVLRKYDPASFPVVILGAYGSLNPLELRRVIDEQIKYRLERINGVAAVDVWGGLEREIHIDLITERLKALNISPQTIVNHVKEENITVPGGAIVESEKEILIRTPGKFRSLQDIRNSIIAIRDRAPIQLKDIATVEDSWARVTRLVRINGVPGVRLAVYKQSGTNTVRAAERVIQEVERINDEYPGIRLVSVMDSASYIKRSITNMANSVLYGGILAVFVLLFFLRNLRSTTVISTAIPISVISSFTLMYFGGFTLNIMTLGGLALGVGMMVDSAIVVLENIYRHKETGLEPYDASVRGAEEVTAAILAGTLTTIAVFIPLVFIRGMSGIMFQQLAFVVSFALLCSLFVSLTLVPMLSAKILKGSHRISTRVFQRLYDMSERAFGKLEDSYKKALHICLQNRGLTIIAGFIIFLGSILLIPLIGVEFMPTADEGQVRVYAEMDVGTPLDTLSEKVKSIEEFIEKEVLEARGIMTNLGSSGFMGGGSHTGQLRISLKPLAERKRTSHEIADDLRRRLKAVGMKIRTRSVQELFALRLFTGDTEDKIQIDIRGYDLKNGEEIAREVMRRLEDIEGITDVNISLEQGAPEALILVDRERASDMKVSPSIIANSLQTMLTGTIAGYYREGSEEVPIRVKLRDADKLSIKDILGITITNPEGKPVILGNLINVSRSIGPVRIDHKDKERVITVSANISGRDMGSIMEDIKERLKGIDLPQDFNISFGGEYEEQQKAFRELLFSFVLAIMLVYMVMASLYESLRHPFVVMFSIPLATIGVVLMLLLTGTTFNVQTYIGCIMLAGIVVNNAILLVDYTNLLRRRDMMPLREAIEEAGRRRLRPILMTTSTTVVALLPLALGIGEGGETQAPLARAVIGGLLSSTFITLLFIPALYLLFEEDILKREITKNSLIVFIILTAILFFIKPSSAEDRNTGDVLNITVEDAILMALENNRLISVERLTPQIKETFEAEEEATFDPLLEGEISVSEEKSHRVSTSGNIFENTLNRRDANLSLNKYLSTGTRLSLDLTIKRLYSDLSPDQHTVRTGMTLTQALLQGGGIDVNLASLREAEINTEISEHEFRALVIAILSEAEKTYWDYYLAQRQMQIYEESLRVAERQLQETKERIDIGILAESELAGAEAEAALRREGLINAKNDLEKTRLRLLRLINPDKKDPWRFDIRLLDLPDRMLITEKEMGPEEIKAHTELATRIRPEIKQAELELKRSDIAVIKSRNGLLPRMDFFITLGKSNYADSFGKAIEIGKDDYYDILAGIHVELPFKNRGAKAEHRRAMLTRRQAEESLENLKQLVEAEVREAIVEINRTIAQVFATEATRRYQEEKVRMETERYRAGKSTMLLVAQAQRDLLESKVKEVEAIINHLKSLIELYRLEGSFLERRGIKIR